MTTRIERTVEELIIDEYNYILKLVKVYDSIVLPDKVWKDPYPSNFLNQGINNRLEVSFESNKRRCIQIMELTGIDLLTFRKFLEAELQKSGNFVRLNLLAVPPRPID
jgi:hypothetical protein